MFDFAGKRVLITGGTRGIGRATADAFIAAGARVAINGRSTDATAKIAAEISAIATPGDVVSREGCRRIVAAAASALGGLDILVTSAGIGPHGPMEEVEEELWDSTLDINLKGTFFCTQAALPHLRRSKGNAVFVASDAGLIGEANHHGPVYPLQPLTASFSICLTSAMKSPMFASVPEDICSMFRDPLARS
jgi:NAD(P)-dependent dehydrogenase (short-subunit alcohol dehydrogenase family)